MIPVVFFASPSKFGLKCRSGSKLTSCRSFGSQMTLNMFASPDDIVLMSDVLAVAKVLIRHRLTCRLPAPLSGCTVTRMIAVRALYSELRIRSAECKPSLTTPWRPLMVAPRLPPVRKLNPTVTACWMNSMSFTRVQSLRRSDAQQQERPRVARISSLCCCASPSFRLCLPGVSPSSPTFGGVLPDPH